MYNLINKGILKSAVLVILVFAVLSINVIAEQDDNTTQLLKQFQVEDNPIDNSTVNSNISIMGDGMDTLENSLFTIFMEPAVSEYYDKICPLFEKSNISGIQMFVDGQLVEFSKYDNVKPVMISGRVLVPLRAIGENLGAKVDWKAENKLIRITQNDKVVELVVDSKTAYINGKKTLLDVPATTINGRTLVPTRFIGEAFYKTVEWHSYSNTLNVLAVY